MLNQKKRIAIIGKYGVGKSYYLNELKKLNFKCDSADNFFQNCYLKNENCYLAIKNNLGSFLVNEEKVDRNQLRNFIKNDFQNIDLLEKNVYPFLEKYLKDHKFDFFEIPIIYSKNGNFEQYFDIVIEIIANDSKIQNNINKKNNLNKAIDDLNKKLNIERTNNNNNKNVIKINVDLLDEEETIKKMIEFHLNK